MRSNAGHGVKCRSCSGVYHETTDKFDWTQRANGTMFVLREPWRSWNWQDFPKDSSVMYESVACPNCGVSYCNGAGYVKLDIDFPLEWIKPHHRQKEIEAAAQEYAEYEPSLPDKQNDHNEDMPDKQVDDDGKSPCPVCGKRMKPSGLHFHIKAKHPDYEGE